MDNRIFVNQPIRPTKKSEQVSQNKKSQTKSKKTSKDFEKLLANKLKKKSGVKFSKHAQKRLVSRDIKLSDSEINRLQNGVKKAENKGAKDSLIMVNDIAYVVSIENKTVITAVDDSNMKENVFTNIDSAVFM